MNYTNQVEAAIQLTDPIERLLSLELIRQELYSGETYRTDEARRLLGRSELPADFWGPLTIAIERAKQCLRLPPKRSDWVKRSPVTSAPEHRLLQDTRGLDGKYWDREIKAWDALAHRASIEAEPALKRADELSKQARAEKAKTAVVTYSEWRS